MDRIYNYGLRMFGCEGGTYPHPLFQLIFFVIGSFQLDNLCPPRSPTFHSDWLCPCHWAKHTPVVYYKGIFRAGVCFLSYVSWRCTHTRYMSQVVYRWCRKRFVLVSKKQARFFERTPTPTQRDLGHSGSSKFRRTAPCLDLSTENASNIRA